MTLKDIFTTADLKKAQRIIHSTEAHLAATKLCEEVVQPRMASINTITKQENSPKYWAYLLLYALS